MEGNETDVFVVAKIPSSKSLKFACSRFFWGGLVSGTRPQWQPWIRQSIFVQRLQNVDFVAAQIGCPDVSWTRMFFGPEAMRNEAFDCWGSPTSLRAALLFLRSRTSPGALRPDHLGNTTHGSLSSRILDPEAPTPTPPLVTCRMVRPSTFNDLEIGKETSKACTFSQLQEFLSETTLRASKHRNIPEADPDGWVVDLGPWTSEFSFSRQF